MKDLSEGPWETFSRQALVTVDKYRVCDKFESIKRDIIFKKEKENNSKTLKSHDEI